MAPKRRLYDSAGPETTKKRKSTASYSPEVTEQKDENDISAGDPRTPQSLVDTRDPDEPTQSIQEKEPIEVLPSNLAHLVQKYCFAKISIKSHSKIQGKVTNIIEHMSRFDYLDPMLKPGIVVLDARSSDASKLISVVEIVKRQLENEHRSGKWYQYNRVSSELIEIPRQKDRNSSNKSHFLETANLEGMGSGIDIDHSTTALDMSSSSKDTKLRAVPVMTTYLSRVPISELKEQFGEATNAAHFVPKC